MTHKLAIARQFGRAAHSYDRAAHLQRDCGDQLLALLNHDDLTGKSLLDVGCGTGHYSQYFKQKGCKVTALDLSVEMLNVAMQKEAADCYVLGDMESLPFNEAVFDYCFSNLTLQWGTNTAVALAELYRVTKPQGKIIFSTLLQGSLAELTKTWLLNQRQAVNAFLSYADLSSICMPYSHQIMSRQIVCDYTSFIEVLKTLKAVGANYQYRSHQIGLMGKAQFKALEMAYPQDQGRFPLTYQLALGIIERE